MRRGHVRLRMAIVTALLTLPLGTGAASERMEDDYSAGGAYVLGLGAGYILAPENLGSGRDDPTGLLPLGGATFSPNGTTHRHAHIQIDDVLFGADAAYDACAHNPDGDLICNADDDSTGVVCGTHTLHAERYAIATINVYTYAVAVTDALDVCGATQGNVRVDLS